MKRKIFSLVTALCMALTMGLPISAYADTVGQAALRDKAVPFSALQTQTEQLIVEGRYDYTQSSKILKQVNKERKAAGAESLVMDPQLQEAAMARAAEIALFFDHQRPDGTECFTISDKIYGENIAAGQANAEEAMDSWMNSPGHRANILDSRYRSIGVGSFTQGYQNYWVQVFGIEKGQSSDKTGVRTKKQTIRALPEELTVFISDNRTTNLFKGRSLHIDTYAAYAIMNGGRSPVQLKPETFRWKSSSSAVSVTAAGKATAKMPGCAAITGTLPVSRKTVRKKIRVPELPPQVRLKSLASAKKGQLTVSWIRNGTVSGYQTVIAQNKSFTKGKKTALIKEKQTGRKIFQNLSGKKTYYAKVRAYKLYGNEKLYGPYSKVMKKKIK